MGMFDDLVTTVEKPTGGMFADLVESPSYEDIQSAARKVVSGEYVPPPEPTRDMIIGTVGKIPEEQKPPWLLKLIAGGEDEAQAIMKANLFRQDPERAKRLYRNDPTIQYFSDRPEHSFIPSLFNTQLDGQRIEEINVLASLTREERKQYNEAKGKITTGEHFGERKDPREYMLFSGVLKFLKSNEFKGAVERLQQDKYAYAVEGYSPEKISDQLIVRDKLLLLEEMEDRGTTLPATVLDSIANMAKYAGEIYLMAGVSGIGFPSTQLGKVGLAATMATMNVGEIATLTAERMTDKGVIGDRGEFIKTEEGQSLLRALPKSFVEQTATYWTEQQGEVIGKYLRGIGGKVLKKLPKGLASVIAKSGKLTEPFYAMLRKGKLDGMIPELVEEYIDRIIKPVLMVDEQYRDKSQGYIERVAKSFIPDGRELLIQTLTFSVMPIGGHITGALGKLRGRPTPPVPGVAEIPPTAPSQAEIDARQAAGVAEMEAELAEIQKQPPIVAEKPPVPPPVAIKKAEPAQPIPESGDILEIEKKRALEAEKEGKIEAKAKPEAVEGKLDKLQEMIKKHPGTLTVAVKLDSGEIIADQKVSNHGELLDKYNLDLNKVADGGFTVGGEYISSITDAKRPLPEVIAAEAAKPAKEVEEEIDETGGISKRRRTRLIKQAEQDIAESELYKIEVVGLEGWEIEKGFYYVPEKFRSEVEDITGKVKGFPTKLQKMFTFSSTEGATDWTLAVQEQLGRGREGVDETWGEMDISDFVQSVKDALESEKKAGRLNAVALERLRETSDPWTQYKIAKIEMMQAGYSVQEIDDMTTEFAKDNDIPLEVFDKEWVGPEALKLKEIKKITDETEQDKALEVLARENVLRRERDEAKQSVNNVLKANKLDEAVEVREVEEIEEEDEIPFEVRGRPTGATVTRAGEQVVLLAYGADSATGYHEGYHVLKRRLVPRDIKILDNHFKGDEEAEATAFAEFTRTGRAAKSYLKVIWRKLLNILKSIKSTLQGRGYRTVNDIFGEIQTGRIAKAGLRPSAVRYEKGVFGQPIEEQLRLPFKERQAAIKRVEAEEKKAVKPAKPKAGKPFAHWRPRGRVRIKSALIKAVDAEIERSMKPKSNSVQITPEEIDKKLSGLFGVAELFYNPRNPLPEVQEAFAQLIKGGPLFDIRYETSTEKMVREAMRRAQVKAEKARLKAIARPRKRKAPALRRIKLNIRDVTPVLRQDLKPLELPPAKEPLRGSRKPPYFSDAWYRENIKKQRKKWFGRLGSVGKRAFLTGEKILTSSSTRLYNIHPELFRQTRKYIYDVLNRTAVMVDDIEPFLKGTNKMSRTDRKQLDLALKNSDQRKITEMVVKHNLQGEYEKAREVLDEIYDAAKEVGIDIEYQRDYWHRHIKDPQGFLEYFQGREDWSIIEEAIKGRAKRAGRKVEDLTDDEKAQVVNTLIRGFRTQALTLSRPGAAKERTVDVVWSDIDQFYDGFGTAILKYIKMMNAKIAEREFFGRETKEIRNLRKVQSARLTRLIKLKRREEPGMPEPAYKEHLSKTYENWKADNERLERLTNRSPKDTIGGYVYDLVRQGQISPIQEKQIRDVLNGIFAPKGMGWGTGLFATAIYIDTLNSPIQALTQLDEFAYAFYRSPLWSIPVAIRTAFRRSKIKPGDIGIKSIGVEFQDPSMKRALTLLLKSTGFELVDRLNKENYINTVLSKYQAQARSRKESPALAKRLARVFGKDYKEVLEDLRRPIKSLDDASDNVKYLLFNELLDIQPIAITEMPEAYNKAGSFRILYTLKTFYIKRLDFMRNECFKDMKSPKTFVRGFSRLVWLALAFAIFGAGSDFLKDWVKGRAFDLKDSFVDNMLRMVMSSKFQVTQAQREGAGRAVLEQWVPPTKIVDEISKDVITIAKGKDRGFEVWRSVPLVGELYYWWFGRGRQKIEKKAKKTTTAVPAALKPRGGGTRKGIR